MISFVHFGRLTSHAVVMGILGKPKEGKPGVFSTHIQKSKCSEEAEHICWS